MKNNKGFILIETIIVICVLTLGLVSLYSSYVLIIQKTNSVNHTNPNNLYIAYQIDKYDFYQINSDDGYKEIYLENGDYYIRTYKNYSSIAKITSEEQKALFTNLGINKIYYIEDYNKLYDSSNKMLLTLDGSTISFIKGLKNNENVKPGKIIVIKKKTQDNQIEFSYYQESNEDNFRNIDYIEDLVRLSNDVNSNKFKTGSYVILNRNLDFNTDISYEDPTRTDFGDLNEDGVIEGIKVELTKTNGKGFTPIGTDATKPFIGNFFGNNKTISNLYINNKQTGKEISLFGRIKDSTIRNLTITGTIKSINGNTVAGIVGISEGKSLIFRCTNKANIDSQDLSNPHGGIIGYVAQGTTNILEISYCKNTGAITNGKDTGGIIGRVEQDANVTINGCTNSGVISKNISSTNINLTPSLSGILGFNSGNTYITSCNNTGNIIYDYQKEEYGGAGGIVGRTNQTLEIISCFNSGTVKSSFTTFSNDNNINTSLGGIIGEVITTGTSFTSKATITDSYNKGSVTDAGRVGGIIGDIHENSITIINNCYNTGQILTSDPKTNSFAGGIIGYSYKATYTILNTYNTGKITASSSYASGITGMDGDSTLAYILNSYNNGEINGKYTNGISVSINTTAKLNLMSIYSLSSVVKGTTEKYIIGKYTTSPVTTNGVFYNSGSNYVASNQTIATSLTINQMKAAEKDSTSLAYKLNQTIKNKKPSEINTDLPDNITYREWTNNTPGTTYPKFK